MTTQTEHPVPNNHAPRPKTQSRLRLRRQPRPDPEPQPESQPQAEAHPGPEPQPVSNIYDKCEAVEDPADADPSAPRRRVRLRLPVLIIAVAVLLVGAGVWMLIEANGLRSSEAARNRALVDTAATAEVTAAVSNSLNRIFSYSYDKTGETEQAAQEVLRGSARDTYQQLFAQVRAIAPQQKLVLTTRVVSSAVQYLDGDHARLLVFLDQSATRVDNNTTSAAAAQLSVTVNREGGTWAITDLAPR